MAGQFRIQYPGEIILMVKALVTVEGLGNQIMPGLNIAEAAQGPVRSIFLDQFNPISILKNFVLVLPEMVDIINTSPLVLSEGLKTFEANLKKPPNRGVAIIRNSILAGFCVLAGAVLLAYGEPWPTWSVLFVLGVVFALRS
jgi:ubiquinone biosynthesis protein